MVCLVKPFCMYFGGKELFQHKKSNSTHFTHVCHPEAAPEADIRARKVGVFCKPDSGIQRDRFDLPGCNTKISPPFGRRSNCVKSQEIIYAEAGTGVFQ